MKLVPKKNLPLFPICITLPYASFSKKGQIRFCLPHLNLVLCPPQLCK